MQYEEALDYIYNLKRFGSKLDLSRTEKLLELLKNPQTGMRIIHVGGTNGKGSVCAMTSNILKEAGYKVGMFTSPHLSRFSERIRINDKQIPRKDVLELVERVKKQCDCMVGESREDHPTFFEFVTAMAFLYFRKNNVDFAVIEVGLGGRLDATNVAMPVVSAVTNVTKEHFHILGDDTRDIAVEKAGIIKQGVVFITASDNPDVVSVLEQRCREKNAEMHNVNDFTVKQRNISLDGQYFDVKTRLKEYNNLFIKALGQHQIANAATAIAISEILARDFDISEEDIRKGLSGTEWPGRLDILSRKPLMVFDSAHNADAIMKLKQTLQNKAFRHDKMILILAISSNKDIKSIAETITLLAHTVIITKHDVMGRSADQGDIRKHVKAPRVIIKDTVKEALDEAIKLADKNDMVCVTGSIFTVGEAREAWFNQKPEGLRIGM